MSTPSSTPSPAVAAAAAAPVDAAQFVFNVNLVLLAAVGVFVLWNAPRAFARFSRLDEWTGFLLRSTRVRRRTLPAHLLSYPPPPSPAHVRDAPTGASDDSHTLYSHTHLIHRVHPSAPRPTYPPRWRTPVPHWVAAALRHRLGPDMSIGQAILLVLYFAVLLYAGLHSSNVFTDPVREGFVAMAQIPFVVAFAAKNGVLGWLLGRGYEKLNFLHRFSGRVVVLCINIHALGYIYSWTLSGTFLARLAVPSNAWGFVGLVAADVLILFSTVFWRTHFYALFRVTHIVALAVLLPALVQHKPATLPYVLATVGIYGLDRVLRISKTRVTTATLRALPALGTTRIEIPAITTGWRAGQHVRIRVFASGLGLGASVAHPLTIASAPGTGGLVLLCKATARRGTWSARLLALAAAAHEEGGARAVRVAVEGPYGGPGHRVLGAYSAVLLVAGGSGISFALAAAEALALAPSRVKALELVWCVPDAAAAAPLAPALAALVQSAAVPLHVSVFYTRAGPGEAREKGKAPVWPKEMAVAPGRPALGAVIDALIARTVALRAPRRAGPHRGLLVAVCGPAALGAEAVRAADAVAPARRRAVGGVEVHEEVFGL